MPDLGRPRRPFHRSANPIVFERKWPGEIRPYEACERSPFDLDLPVLLRGSLSDSLSMMTKQQHGIRQVLGSRLVVFTLAWLSFGCLLGQF